MPKQKSRTRFAPSPSGLLHLGHAYSALFAEKEAKDGAGTLLLRFEDIDREGRKVREESGEQRRGEARRG